MEYTNGESRFAYDSIICHFTLSPLEHMEKREMSNVHNERFIFCKP